MRASAAFARLLVVLALFPVAAVALVQWRSGQTVYTSAIDFTTGFTPNGTGCFVSQAFIANPPQPTVGRRQDVSISMAGIVSPAAVRLMAVHFVPPAGTTVVVDAATPIRCFQSAMNGRGPQVEFTDTVITDRSFNANLRIFGCPQPAVGGTPCAIVQLPDGNGSAFFLDRRDPQRPGQTNWPMGSQATYEFQIPVASNRTTDGFSAGGRFVAPVQSIQGDGVEPWAYPFLSLLVSPASGGSVADMEAGLFGAPPPAPQGSTAVVVDCRNRGPNPAQNATCGFTNTPADLKPLSSATPRRRWRASR